MVRYRFGSLPASCFSRSALRIRRQDIGLSLRALSDCTGVAASTISRIENGLFTPTLLTAVRLAEALGLDLSDAPGIEGAESTAGPDRDVTEAGPLSLVTATSPVAVRRQSLPPGTRKDLRRVASGQPYRFLVVLDGEVQIRGRDGSRLSLRPGLRLDCDLLRKDTFFATSTERAELLWIG
jgi:transcriptional regulator with XRE-family HTH domain